jgi:outer membrane protein assembly factor BamD
MFNWVSYRAISNLRTILAVSVILILANCSKFRAVERSEDWRVKYDAALSYYEKKDYYHSSILFEQIQPIVRGLPEGEKVEFYLGYCRYYEKTYLLASNQFKTFYETYGRSQLAIEARFMYAYSLYISSPDFNLDQKSSVEAMAAMQNFLNMYPSSTFQEKAVGVIANCQEKLERKGFEDVTLYLKLKQYKAAIVAMDGFRKNFPDSHYIEELLYKKIIAQHALADQSISTKQLERYNLTLESYRELVDTYPNSAFLKQAEKLYSDSLEKANKLKPKNSNS